MIYFFERERERGQREKERFGRHHIINTRDPYRRDPGAAGEVLST